MQWAQEFIHRLWYGRIFFLGTFERDGSMHRRCGDVNPTASVENEEKPENEARGRA
jgi:hypothetical protein